MSYRLRLLTTSLWLGLLFALQSNPNAQPNFSNPFVGLPSFPTVPADTSTTGTIIPTPPSTIPTTTQPTTTVPVSIPTATTTVPSTSAPSAGAAGASGSGSSISASVTDISAILAGISGGLSGVSVGGGLPAGTTTPTFTTSPFSPSSSSPPPSSPASAPSTTHTSQLTGITGTSASTASGAAATVPSSPAPFPVVIPAITNAWLTPTATTATLFSSSVSAPSITDVALLNATAVRQLQRASVAGAGAGAAGIGADTRTTPALSSLITPDTLTYSLNALLYGAPSSSSSSSSFLSSSPVASSTSSPSSTLATHALVNGGTTDAPYRESFRRAPIGTRTAHYALVFSPTLSTTDSTALPTSTSRYLLLTVLIAASDIPIPDSFSCCSAATLTYQAQSSATSPIGTYPVLSSPRVISLTPVTAAVYSAAVDLAVMGPITNLQLKISIADNAGVSASTATLTYTPHAATISPAGNPLNSNPGNGDFGVAARSATAALPRSTVISAVAPSLAGPAASSSSDDTFNSAATALRGAGLPGVSLASPAMVARLSTPLPLPAVTRQNSRDDIGLTSAGPTSVQSELTGSIGEDTTASTHVLTDSATRVQQTMLVGVEPSTDPDVMVITSMPSLNSDSGGTSWPTGSASTGTGPVQGWSPSPNTGLISDTSSSMPWSSSPTTTTPTFTTTPTWPSPSPSAGLGNIAPLGMATDTATLTPLDTGALMVKMDGVSGAYWCDVITRTSTDTAIVDSTGIAATYGEELAVANVHGLSGPVRTSMVRADVTSFMVPSLSWRSSTQTSSRLLLQVVCGNGQSMVRSRIAVYDSPDAPSMVSVTDIVPLSSVFSVTSDVLAVISPATSADIASLNNAQAAAAAVAVPTSTTISLLTPLTPGNPPFLGNSPFSGIAVALPSIFPAVFPSLPSTSTSSRYAIQLWATDPRNATASIGQQSASASAALPGVLRAATLRYSVNNSPSVDVQMQPQGNRFLYTGLELAGGDVVHLRFVLAREPNGVTTTTGRQTFTAPSIVSLPINTVTATTLSLPSSSSSSTASATASAATVPLPTTTCMECVATCSPLGATTSPDNPTARCWSDCCPGEDGVALNKLVGSLVILNPTLTTSLLPSPAAASNAVSVLAVKPWSRHAAVLSSPGSLMALANDGSGVESHRASGVPRKSAGRDMRPSEMKRLTAHAGRTFTVQSASPHVATLPVSHRMQTTQFPTFPSFPGAAIGGGASVGLPGGMGIAAGVPGAGGGVGVPTTAIPGGAGVGAGSAAGGSAIDSLLGSIGLGGSGSGSGSGAAASSGGSLLSGIITGLEGAANSLAGALNTTGLAGNNTNSNGGTGGSSGSGAPSSSGSSSALFPSLGSVGNPFNATIRNLFTNGTLTNALANATTGVTLTNTTLGSTRPNATTSSGGSAASAGLATLPSALENALGLPNPFGSLTGDGSTGDGSGSAGSGSSNVLNNLANAIDGLTSGVTSVFTPTTPASSSSSFAGSLTQATQSLAALFGSIGSVMNPMGSLSSVLSHSARPDTQGTAAALAAVAVHGDLGSIPRTTVHALTNATSIVDVASLFPGLSARGQGYMPQNSAGGDVPSLVLPMVTVRDKATEEVENAPSISVAARRMKIAQAAKLRADIHAQTQALEQGKTLETMQHRRVPGRPVSGERNPEELVSRITTVLSNSDSGISISGNTVSRAIISQDTSSSSTPTFTLSSLAPPAPRRRKTKSNPFTSNGGNSDNNQETSSRKPESDFPNQEIVAAPARTHKYNVESLTSQRRARTFSSSASTLLDSLLSQTGGLLSASSSLTSIFGGSTLPSIGTLTGVSQAASSSSSSSSSAAPGAAAASSALAGAAGSVIGTLIPSAGDAVDTEELASFINPLNMAKVLGEFPAQVRDNMCINAACYASCLTSMEEGVSSMYASIDSLGLSTLTPPQVPTATPAMPYYSPEYVRAVGLPGVLAGSAPQANANAQLPSLTPQMMKAMTPMLIEATTKGATTMYDLVGSVSNTAACVNSCRVACQAGDQSSTNACSSGNTLICMGSGLDRFVDINQEVGNQAAIAITKLDQLVNGVLPGFLTFDAQRPMQTMAATGQAAAEAVPGVAAVGTGEGHAHVPTVSQVMDASHGMHTQAHTRAEEISGSRRMQPLWDFTDLINGVSSAAGQIKEAVDSVSSVIGGVGTPTSGAGAGGAPVRGSIGGATGSGSGSASNSNANIGAGSTRPLNTVTNQAAVNALSSMTSLPSLFAYQSSNAQAVAAAAALEDLVWAARNAYGASVPTERWLAMEANTITAATKESAAVAASRSRTASNAIANSLSGGGNALAGPSGVSGSSSSAVVASLTQLVQSLGTVAEVTNGTRRNRVNVFAPGAALYNALSLLQL